MDKFQDKFRIPSARLKGYDYSSNGMYFITIKTKNDRHYFGEFNNNDNELQKTIIGNIANEYWLKIAELYDYVHLDDYVLMPNHIHGILMINKMENPKEDSNKFGVQKNNLASIVRGFKSTTKKFANENNIEFEWLSRFHDRVIRNEKELNEIRNYIFENPAKWIEYRNRLNGNL